MNTLSLAPIFQHHMVLQREKPIKVWGEGPKGAIVTVTLDGISASTVVHQNKWMCTLPSHPAARDLTLTVSTDIPGFPILYLKDISIGDIWIAAGQSNMEYFLRYDVHWEEMKRQPINPDIHMFNVPQLCFEGQQRDNSGSGYWFQEQDKAWELFSAPGYAFARSIQPHLDVPVAIIGCNWGGTPACAWIEESYLENPPLDIFQKEYEAEVKNWDPLQLRKEALTGFAYDDSQEHQEEWKAVMYGLTREEQLLWVKEHSDAPAIPMGPLHKDRPSGLYHMMLEPLAPLAIKGVLWYQGESDSGHAEIYDTTMTALISCWRNLWKDDFPFLFVQLAPFDVWLDCTGDNYPEVRRRQEMVSRQVPGVYMTSIMDLGMRYDIHPKHKKEVGERLALLARGCVYGEDILCLPPEFQKAEKSGNTILLHIQHTGTGLSMLGESISALTVTSEGDVLEPLSQTVSGAEIQLTFEDEIESCKIEFANENYVEVNVFNSAGLPLKPFICEV